MHSITSRITGLMFLSIFLTVIVLVYLANYQMTQHFQHYLAFQPPAASTGAMETPEQAMLESLHQSLYWVGIVILAFGLLASIIVARSITIPIRKLGDAVEAISAGLYGQKVASDSRSELGKLAQAFNNMSESLAESTRQRQRLLADIVHELRTPLSVIQGNIEGMLEGVVEKDAENLSSLQEEIIYVNRMITDLRDLSLAEAGQLRLEKEPAEINAMVTRALYMLEPSAGEKELTFTANLTSLPPVEVDPRRINQVLYNLLTNAIRYTPPGGTIAVTTEILQTAGSSWLQIAVSDNGCGISSADLPHIFEHFYRADKSRDKKSGGSGIGLAIVKRLTELHGGMVGVVSDIGRGSTFYVRLPLKDKTPASLPDKA